METEIKKVRTDDFDENPFDWMICKTGARRIFAESFFSCVRYCANQVPQKMTLDRLRILAALLVILMPRPLTYILLYPIFRLVFGNLYPAYASYKAVRTKNVKEYVKWMMYWIVFALFTCAETFTDVFFSFWFPFYYEIKTILVVWLLSPATKGSSILYRRFVHPALIRREAEIDDALARATEQGYTAVLHLGTKGVNYATTVLMQTAIKVKHLMQLREKMANNPSTSRPQTSSSGVFSSDRPAPASSLVNLEMEEDQLDEFETENPMVSTSYDELVPLEPVPSMDDVDDSTVDDPHLKSLMNLHYEKDSYSNSFEDTSLPRKRKNRNRGKHTKCLRSTTCAKGGGGLVQHLKKSYSLSDLTGEKEDENRNTPHMHDETDMEVEPRRREHVGRRSYSPRRTQSSSNRVEMYFSEVDVDVRQPRSREPTASLTNIRSSDDISSGYSSGEALQSSRTLQGDSLVRTSSVGARTRAKPRSTTKKTPEDPGEDIDGNDPPFSTNISFPSPLTHVTPEQALEILLLLSQNSNVADYMKLDRGPLLAGNNDHSLENTSQSGPQSCRKESKSSDPVPIEEVQIIQSVETKTVAEHPLPTSVDTQVEQIKVQQETTEAKIGDNIAKEVSTNEEVPDESAKESNRTATDELCQNKFDELKQLLSDARKAVNNIVYAQESRPNEAIDAKIVSEEDPLPNVDAKKVEDTEIVPEVSEDTKLDKETEDMSITKVDSESDVWTSSTASRAGKYNKKPAPKAPLAKTEEDLDDADSQNALKATLVIKTGTLKTFSNTSATKDVFIAHVAEAKAKGKKSKRQRTKEGFSKLLTIPKNIFHSAFSKEQKGLAKGDDSISDDVSASESRSISLEPQETIIELAPKRSGSINSQTDDKSENDTSNSSDSYILASNNEAEPPTENEVKDEPIMMIDSESSVREMSQSPKAGKRLESDIY